MKLKTFWALVFSLSLVSLAHGQTAANAAPVVFGRGTPNFIPIWTHSNTIGTKCLRGGFSGLGADPHNHDRKSSLLANWRLG